MKPTHKIQTAFFFIILFFAFTASNFAQTKPVALVVKTSGLAYHLKDGKKTPVKVNDFVQEGGIIQTKKNAAVHLQFSNGVIFLIGSPASESEVKVTNFSNSGSQEIGLQVLKGSLAASAEKLSKKDNIRIQTPTAIAGVRGTEFIVDVDKDSTEVLVNDGAVSVSDIEEEKEVMVEPGNKVVATTTGLQLEILEQFEKQRFEIIQALEDSRQKNIQALIEQIERDRQNLESVKNPFDN